MTECSTTTAARVGCGVRHAIDCKLYVAKRLIESQREAVGELLSEPLEYAIASFMWDESEFPIQATGEVASRCPILLSQATLTTRSPGSRAPILQNEVVCRPLVLTDKSSFCMYAALVDVLDGFMKDPAHKARIFAMCPSCGGAPSDEKLLRLLLL